MDNEQRFYLYLWALAAFCFCFLLGVTSHYYITKYETLAAAKDPVGVACAGNYGHEPLCIIHAQGAAK